MSDPAYKIVATGIAALVCVLVMGVTYGRHGPGWFVLSLFVIWILAA